MGSLKPPIVPSVLADIQNATIMYSKRSKNWTASLMPMGTGFIISVNSFLSEQRIRNAICHEIAHTFFYDIDETPPQRRNKPRPDAQEELLCFWAAREMLVPSSLFKEELDRVGSDRVYSFEGISQLADVFSVSPDIVAYRLTHDLALLGNDWIVLWYSESYKNKEPKAQSLYPKEISMRISNYTKAKIVEKLRLSLEQSGVKDFNEFEVGKRNKIRIKSKNEIVNRQQLKAISWVTPLSGV